MIKRHKLFFGTLLGLLLFAGAASAYVGATILHYRKTPPCGQLTGLGGVLQKAKLVASLGNCQVVIHNGVAQCKNLGNCQVTVEVRNPDPTGPPTILRTVNGHCQNDQISGCVCAPTQ